MLTPSLQLSRRTVLFTIYQATLNKLKYQVAHIIRSQWLYRARQNSLKSKGRQCDLTSCFIIGSIKNAAFTVGIQERAHTLGIEINTVNYMLISLSLASLLRSLECSYWSIASLTAWSEPLRCVAVSTGEGKKKKIPAHSCCINQFQAKQIIPCNTVHQYSIKASADGFSNTQQQTNKYAHSSSAYGSTEHCTQGVLSSNQ